MLVAPIARTSSIGINIPLGTEQRRRIRAMARVKAPYTRDVLAKFGASVGEYSYGVPTLRWWGESVGLQIGNYCSFADEVQIFLGGNHRTDCVTSYPFASFVDWPEVPDVDTIPETKGNVIIGNDVWVCSGAIILSGVTIGDGAVIGARAVVSRDVSPYSIVAGNPARVVRKRFAEDVIQELLRIRWWDWSRERIEQYLPLLLSNDLNAFLAASRAATISGA